MENGYGTIFPSSQHTFIFSSTIAKNHKTPKQNGKKPPKTCDCLLPLVQVELDSRQNIWGLYPEDQSSRNN